MDVELKKIFYHLVDSLVGLNSVQNIRLKRLFAKSLRLYGEAHAQKIEQAIEEAFFEGYIQRQDNSQKRSPKVEFLKDNKAFNRLKSKFLNGEK